MTEGVPPARADSLPGVYCAWRGPALLVLDADGCALPDRLTGFFFRESRFVSRLELRLNGERLFCCSAAQAGANRLEFTYVYPPVDIGAGGGSGSGGQSMYRGILRRGLDLRLSFDVHPSWVDITLHAANRWQASVDVEIEWLLQADYFDMTEIQSGKPHRERPVSREPDGSALRFVSCSPELPFRTEVSGDGLQATDGGLAGRLTLERQRPLVVQLRIRAIDGENTIGIDEGLLREVHLERWNRRAAVITSPADGIATIVNQGRRDLGSLSLLEGTPDEWLTPSAGVPLYLALWGRDALTAVWQGALFDRAEMACAALVRIGRLQGREVNPENDEQPGRIIQQVRNGPLERLGLSPFKRYYADQASPFDYVFALAHAYACTGERELVARHWDTLRRIMDWAREYGDGDGDGYVEYLTQSPKGPRHQGWKDSDNAIVDEFGRQVQPPLAACEVQGYYFAALQIMAVLSAVMREPADAVAYWQAARLLRQRFDRDFWMDGEGFIALGLDSEKRQIRAVTSNAGQALATGIATEERVPRLVRRLFEPDLFSGWGIRTLSARNPAYNPLDYHLGSVWPIENATIVFGLRRFGFDQEALRLARALFDLAGLWPAYRAPECVGGYARDELAHPGVYPRANAPQMWNQSGWLLILQSILGLQPMAPIETLALDPVLPEWLPQVTLHRLRIGNAVVTLRFERDQRGGTDFQVLRREGTLRLLRQPSPNSLKANLWDRLAAALGVVKQE